MTSPVTLAARRPELVAVDAWKRLGLLVLATDLTSERDFARLFPQERVGVYATRVAFDNPTTPENLSRMGPRLGAAAELLRPLAPLDAICYSCTSASVELGDDVVRDAVQAVHPGVPVVTPTAAARLAFAALGVRRVAVLTPYLVDTGRPMAAYFERHGLDVVRFECLGLEDDRDMARVRVEDIVAAACAVDRPEAEAVFLSCTALLALAAIADIEARLGKPVVSSNQASIWAMRHFAGIEARPTGHGRLFELDPPTSGA